MGLITMENVGDFGTPNPVQGTRQVQTVMEDLGDFGTNPPPAVSKPVSAQPPIVLPNLEFTNLETHELVVKAAAEAVLKPIEAAAVLEHTLPDGRKEVASATWLNGQIGWDIAEVPAPPTRAELDEYMVPADKEDAIPAIDFSSGTLFEQLKKIAGAEEIPGLPELSEQVTEEEKTRLAELRADFGNVEAVKARNLISSILSRINVSISTKITFDTPLGPVDVDKLPAGTAASVIREICRYAPTAKSHSDYLSAATREIRNIIQDQKTLECFISSASMYNSMYEWFEGIQKFLKEES
jgi:hypothetical protein